MKNLLSKKLWSLVLLAMLSLGSINQVQAHAVQLTYCASCASTLRLWFEHWHSTEAVTSTTMTISITIGGTTTTTTGNPLTNLQNTPITNLPGCNAPPIVFASCPGTANTYNDWVNFDYNNVPCGVPINITVVSGSTAFTMDGCGMYPASTGTFTIPCNVNKPVSSFIPPAAVCLGVPMTFTDNSTGGNPTLFYDWDFGDGSPNSTAQNPTHTYTAPGNYCVTLKTKKTIGGCEDDTTICVVVEDQPNPNFTFAPKCSGFGTPFTDASTIGTGTITQWSWDFGDGNTSTQQSPTHAYANCGNYNVKLVVTSQGGCTDSITQVVAIPCSPNAQFTFDTVCFGNPTSFTDLSTAPGGPITIWQWNFGGGTSNNQNPQHTFGTIGTHTVTLTVTSSDGCTDSISKQVDIHATPSPAFAAPAVCNGFPTQFTDQSTANPGVVSLWSWDFGGTGNSTIQHPTHQFPGPGTYNVKLVVGTGPTCQDSVTIPVTVNDQPVAGFTTADVCYGNIVSFTDGSNINTGNIQSWFWDFGDNSGTSTNQHPTYNYGAPGVYTVKLVVTSDQGCMDSTTVVVNVFPQPVVNFSRNTVCDGTPMQFSDLTTMVGGGNPNLVWDFDGLGNSAAPTPSFLFPACGSYDVKLTALDPQGCVDSVTKTIYVNCNPVVDFVADVVDGCAPVCPNFTNNTTIAGGNIATWSWNFGDGSNGASQNPSHCYDNTGLTLLTYDVTLTATSDSGCVTTVTKPSYISAFPWPIANFGTEPDIVKISEPDITFPNWSKGANTWTWDFGDGGTDLAYSPTHTYKDTGNYTVWLYIENQWGCRDSTAKVVRVDPEVFIYIPNAFTPTGDGINDSWRAKFWGVEEANTFVFDRWGELIWEGHELDSRWDGTYKGQKAKTDTYVYLLKVKTVLGEHQEYRGKVTLLK